MTTGKRSRRLIVAMVAAATTLWSLAPAAPAPAATPAPGTPPANLARAVAAYHRATVRKDTQALAELVTDDYVLVNSDASVQGKISYLADFAAPGFKLDPYETEPLVHQVRGDAALTAWTFKLSWVQEGRKQTRTLRLAHFWVSEHGQWRIAYTQLTRVPD